MLRICVLITLNTCIQCSQPPRIAINSVSKSQLSISCSRNDYSTRKLQFKRVSNTSEASIEINQESCALKTTLPNGTVKCNCLESNTVLCTIFEGTYINDGDKWICQWFQHNLPVNSNIVIVSLHDTSPKPSTGDHISAAVTASEANENISAGNETLMTTSGFTEKTFTTESVNITAPGNANKTTEIYRQESDRNPEPMSNRQLMIIMAIVGVAIVIGTNASICTYWQMKNRLRAEQQSSAIMLSDTETTTEENTHVHYYEIEDTPSHFSYDGSTVPNSLNTIEAIDHFENSPQVHFENIALTSTTEPTNIIQINTMGQQDNTVQTRAIDQKNISQITCKLSTEASTSNSSNILRTSQVHGGFMTLADINIFGGAVADSDGPNDPPCNRINMECSHYENLDPTGRDANSQYTTLV